MALYHSLVEQGTMEMNPAQGQAIYRLSHMFEQLADSRDGTPRGLYIHGPVGCGKTLAMDIFATCVHMALPRKRLFRTHLNEFLELVHSELRRLESEHDGRGQATVETFAPCTLETGGAGISKPFNLGRQDDRGMRRTGSAAAWVHHARKGATRPSISRLGAELAKQMDVLCLDEVAISNLQNCVLLGPLVQALCQAGVVLVATANKAPADLYADGLDRERHLAPWVDAVRNNCDVYHYRSTIDYRKRLPVDSKRAQVFGWSCEARSPESRSFLEAWWGALAGTAKARVESVPVGYGRRLPVQLSHCQACVRFNFEDLCTFPPIALGAADYSVLCKQFSTLVVVDVPRLRPETHDAARRWTLFLDSCYENHVRLILSTIARGPDDLIDLSDVDAGEGQSLQEASFAVARAVSRMYEMQSAAYLDACSARGACAPHL